MSTRLLKSILFAGVFAVGVSSAQEGIAEVPIPRNVYPQIVACGAGGQAYFPSIGDEHFVLRVSLDGSNLRFGLPDKTYVKAVATYEAGVNVLGGCPNVRQSFTASITKASCSRSMWCRPILPKR